MKLEEKPEAYLTACPYWGKGGQYVLDPATGQRVRVEVAEESPPADGAEQGSETKKVTTKEKARG
ncbi:hypothetical protein [Undibacterium sp. Ren11W]|uniref:hypothetical protein n=1 Tax=Undibacterium sp. Ren11W TaxID=3413045 RepID=UPI003BF0AC2C